MIRIKSGKNAVIIIAIFIIIIVAVALVSYKLNEEPTTAKSQLTLTDYPEIFKKDVIIVIGENANSIEIEAARRIADNLDNLTGNMPVIKTDAEITGDELAGHNLILVGGADSNEVLQKVYDMTDAMRVTDEYHPGACKGVLEILRNPWGADKAMLLNAGSDEWGVKAGSEIIEQSQQLNEANIAVEWKESGAVIVKEFPLGEGMSAGKHYPSESFRVEEYDVSEVIERAKETDYWIRYGSAYGGPYTYYNGSECKKIYAYKEGYVSITRHQEEYWFTIGPANPDDPTNCESIVMFAPQENIAIDTACEIVKNELMEIGINLKYSKKIEWDLNKSFVPPTTGLTKEGGI